MTFRKKRGDTKIGNVKDLPKSITTKYRRDTHLSTVLSHHGVTTKSQLKKKLSKKNC